MLPIGPPGPVTGFPSGPSIGPCGPPLPMLIIPASMLHKVFISPPGPKEFPEGPALGPIMNSLVSEYRVVQNYVELYIRRIIYNTYENYKSVKNLTTT